jgi:hypothetical protein
MGEREVEIPPPSCSSRAQVGCACSRGYKRPHGGRSERPYASARLVLVPERPHGGGVAECYVSSGGELAP